jgi:hypothetical protein
MFLRFASITARDEFLEKAGREEPQLLRHVRVSKVQPDIVTVSSATPGESRLLRQVAGSEVKIYDDIEFETFEPG